MNGETGKESNGGFGDVFSNGLPSMVGIVTLISQPVVQVTGSLGLPQWFPYALAIAVSGLLAYYRIRVVRRSLPAESAILVPLLTLVIFSAYVTGNNVIFYTKEGYSRAAVPSAPSSAELEALKNESEILKQKLQAAEEVIAALRQSVTGAGAAQPRSSLPSWLAMLGAPGVDEAWAQEPPARPGSRPPAKPTAQQLRDLLQKYDAQQRELDRKLKEAKKEQEKIQTQPEAPPLLKKW